jgi:hypothetical protein
VPKKESKERFSSMITTTWQILWMPRCEAGQRTPDEEEPQPAAATAASRSRATVVARLS